jgi:hypothetical protein
MPLAQLLQMQSPHYQRRNWTRNYWGQKEKANAASAWTTCISATKWWCCPAIIGSTNPVPPHGSASTTPAQYAEKALRVTQLHLLTTLLVQLEAIMRHEEWVCDHVYEAQITQHAEMKLDWIRSEIQGDFLRPEKLVLGDTRSWVMGREVWISRIKCQEAFHRREDETRRWVRINGIVGEEIRVVVIDHETPDEVQGRRLAVATMEVVDRYPGFEIDSEDRTMIAVGIR